MQMHLDETHALTLLAGLFLGLPFSAEILVTSVQAQPGTLTGPVAALSSVGIGLVFLVGAARPVAGDSPQ